MDAISATSMFGQSSAAKILPVLNSVNQDRKDL